VGRATNNTPNELSPREPPAATGTADRSPAASAHSNDSVWDRMAYVAFAYAVLHGVQMLRATFEWPLLVPRITVMLLLIGVPVVATLAWYRGHRAQHQVSGIECSF
jgi:hypothetical protein